jgi:hypothetical protein
MGYFKHNWSLLDVELIRLCNVGKVDINNFAVENSIPIGTVTWRIRKLGFKVIRFQPKMENSFNWKGGKLIDEKGYVRVYIGNGKYAKEHRLVMEKKLGRKLTKDEDVHHIDESFVARSNNDPSNLELKTKIEHTKHHLKGDKGYCISFNKASVRQWRLRIRNKADTQWISFGLYFTEEQALKVVEKLKVRGMINDITEKARSK